MQKNLFGAVKVESKEKEPVGIKAKSTFPELSLVKGLHKQEAMLEAVFWHRILINKSISQQQPIQFLQILSNEISLKKGIKDSYLTVLDSLKRRC